MFIRNFGVKQIFALPFFISVGLFTQCTEQPMPVFGHECFEVERNQLSVPINDQVKAEYFILTQLINPNIEGLALNRFYSTENMNTLISVDLENNRENVQNMLNQGEAESSRLDAEDAHYLYKRDSLFIYAYAEQQKEAVVVYWNYSLDSARIADQFSDTEFYAKKICDTK